MSEIYSTLNLNDLLISKKKGDICKLRIAESAIEIIYENGLENFTYDVLAKKSQTSRPLIYHYFPSLNELFLFMAAIIRHKYQTAVINEMRNKVLIADVLRAYIQGALNWFDINRKEASVWLIYFIKCSQSQAVSTQNKQLVEMGTQRIQQLLDVGLMKGEFKFNPPESSNIARRIQILITGHLISRATENRTPEHWHSEFKDTVEFCLSLVGVKSSPSA